MARYLKCGRTEGNVIYADNTGRWYCGISTTNCPKTDKGIFNADCLSELQVTIKKEPKIDDLIIEVDNSDLACKDAVVFLLRKEKERQKDC